MSAFRFSLSIIVSRLQRFQFAIECFKLLKMIVFSKEKQLSKIGLRLFVEKLSLGYLTQILCW